MKNIFKLIVFLLGVLVASCEEKIDLKIEDSDPKLIIKGEVNNFMNSQHVTVFETTGLQDTVRTKPISGAEVSVQDSKGVLYTYVEESPGIYKAKGMQGKANSRYVLSVKVNGVVYQATSVLPEMVQVDSVGTYSTNFFGRESKFITIKYQDPPGIPNYYRYSISVNGGTFEYVGVYSDRYNDGKYVSQELALRDIELQSGDKVRINRQCIDQGFYDFWSSQSFSNPGAAAPANPKSNISNQALGYFGAYSQLSYQIEIP